VPSQIIARGYAFLALCLLWTYAVGVGDMVAFLTCTTRVPPMRTLGSLGVVNKKGNHGGGRHVYVPSVVQSFIPCHLRFGHILLESGSHLVVAVAVSAGILAWKVYRNNNNNAAGAGRSATSSTIHPEYCCATPPHAPGQQHGDAPGVAGAAGGKPLPSMYVTYSAAADIKDHHANALLSSASVAARGGMAMAPSPIVVVVDDGDDYAGQDDKNDWGADAPPPPPATTTTTTTTTTTPSVQQHQAKENKDADYAAAMAAAATTMTLLPPPGDVMQASHHHHHHHNTQEAGGVGGVGEGEPEDELAAMFRAAKAQQQQQQQFR
jgi:hypothetical protein